MSLLPFSRYQGLLFPHSIGSGSMAASLHGPHYELACRDCLAVFRFGVETPPALGHPICPNCGFRETDLSSARLQRGDQVAIDRWAFAKKNPTRWDVVAHPDPAGGGRFTVKRVVGLPSEHIAIRDGDVFVNGQVIRKAYKETRQLATLVHDDRNRSTDRSLPPRWASDDQGSGWRPTPDGYEYSPTGAIELDWLTYRHWRCYGSPHPRSDESPITDNNPYNQGLSRSLQHARDLLVRVDLELEATADAPGLFIRVHDGYENITFDIGTGSGTVRVLRGDMQFFEKTVELSTANDMNVVVGVVDRQAFVVFDDAVAVREPYDRASTPVQPTSRPISIAANSAVTLSSLQVWRDIHYLDPHSVGRAWTMTRPLGDDEYLLFGDNSPLSQDSRHWATPAVRRRQIAGRVVPIGM